MLTGKPFQKGNDPRRNTTGRPKVGERIRTAFIDMDEPALKAIKAGLSDADPEVALKYVQIWAAYRLGTPRPEPLFDQEEQVLERVVEAVQAQSAEKQAEVLNVLSRIGFLPAATGTRGADPGSTSEDDAVHRAQPAPYSAGLLAAGL